MLTFVFPALVLATESAGSSPILRVHIIRLGDKYLIIDCLVVAILHFVLLGSSWAHQYIPSRRWWHLRSLFNVSFSPSMRILGRKWRFRRQLVCGFHFGGNHHIGVILRLLAPTRGNHPIRCPVTHRLRSKHLLFVWL